MTLHVYRYRRDRPATTALLQRLIGTPVSLVAISSGIAFDIQLEDAYLPDADEVLALFGFVRIATDPTTPVAPRRVVASGSVTIGANATVTLGTFTRNAAERLVMSGFVTNNNAGAAFFSGGSAVLSDSVAFFLDRTANADEFRARAINGNLLASRTFEWLIEAVSPE